MSHCAAISLKKLDRVPQMLRRLSVECCCRCMMLRGRQATFNGARRRWRARVLGSDMNLVDRLLCVAAGAYTPVSMIATGGSHAHCVAPARTTTP